MKLIPFLRKQRMWISLYKKGVAEHIHHFQEKPAAVRILSPLSVISHHLEKFRLAHDQSCALQWLSADLIKGNSCARRSEQAPCTVREMSLQASLDISGKSLSLFPVVFALSQGIGDSNIIMSIPWHHCVQTPCLQQFRTILFLVLLLIILTSSRCFGELFELPLCVQIDLYFFIFFSQFSL